MTSATEDNDRDLFLAQRWRLNELTTYQGESNDAAIIRLAVQFLDRTGPRASARDAEIWLARGLGDLDNALDRWEAEADGADGQDHEDQPTNKKRRAEGSEARKFIPLTSVQAIVHQASTASQHAHLLLLANTEEDHQLHGPLFQQCLEAVNRTLQQHTGFSTDMESEWAPHGIYGVACPSCLTPFNVRLH